ncbi:TPA: hypothetical protein SB194_002044, partial [Campylobacter coli]|nr:hypothetical protein [Campylobacter coli]HEF9796869.1 hypothetical protein [Campylobacter coli]
DKWYDIAFCVRSIDDVAAMVAGQIGQLTPMDEETADLFKQLAKKMMKGIE